MSNDEDNKSGWTKPPRGRRKKYASHEEKLAANRERARERARDRGVKNTVQRRNTRDRVREELAAQGAPPQNPEPPLMTLVDAMDLEIPEPIPIEPNTGGGGATPYREEYAHIARAMCELGATDIMVARALRVSLSTMWGWQSRHEEFFRAMIVGKDLPDEKVIRALYQRAVGYSYPEIDIRTVNGTVVATPLIKHIPPDVTACQAWLRSRRRTEWNPTQQVNLSSDQAFHNLWTAVSQGQTMPLLELESMTIEDGDAAA